MPGALSEAITAFIKLFDEFWQIWSEPGPLWVIGSGPTHVSAEDRARNAEEERLRKLVTERGTNLASLLANKHHKPESIAVIDLLHAIEQSDNLAPKWQKLKPALQYLTMVPERDADPMEQAIAQLLLNVPETWTEFDRDTHSELRERAHYQLIAAGMIEQRTTLRLRMFGNPVAVEATITLTGEGGFAEAMEPVLADIWHDWKVTFEQRLKSDLKDSPGCHCERIGKEQWRLTAQGIVALNDLGTDKESTVLDFVLKRGFFDGQPRRLANGKISQRLPLAGSGKLERMVRVSANASPAGVTIANWNDGAQLFASAFAELLKEKEAQPANRTPKQTNPPSILLLRVFTNGLADERIEKAAQVLLDDKLTANEKLEMIDNLIPFPATTSAEQLGEMLGVSKQAILKTDWWVHNRKGEKDNEIGRRRTGHKKRSKGYEAPSKNEDGK